MSEQESIEIRSMIPDAEKPENTKKPRFSRITDEFDENFGLLTTVDYVFDNFGFVDWRKLIPEGFLFVNAKKFEELGKEAPKTIDGLEDSQIVIKLGGIKWLARVRGYEKVSFQVLSQDSTNVVVKCAIDWIPNFENPLGATYEEIASCNPKNAEELNIKFAESIAANRAFVRCVRNFLNVNIVGEEEIFNKTPEIQTSDSGQQNGPVAIDPQSIFVKIAKEKGMKVEEIVSFCAKNDPTVIEDELRGVDETSLAKKLTPKQAKKLLKAIKKA